MGGLQHLMESLALFVVPWCFFTMLSGFKFIVVSCPVWALPPIALNMPVYMQITSIHSTIGRGLYGTFDAPHGFTQGI